MKTTPWVKIKAEYLQGVTPKELAVKYKIKAKAISDKANEDKWVAEKTKISENVRKDVQEKIKEYANTALEALMKIINDEESKNSDIVQASKAILDVSGLKSMKQEITGANGEALSIQKEYILPEQIKQFEEHFKNTVGD